jgi:hypothetical protein
MRTTGMGCGGGGQGWGAFCRVGEGEVRGLADNVGDSIPGRFEE